MRLCVCVAEVQSGSSTLTLMGDFANFGHFYTHAVDAFSYISVLIIFWRKMSRAGFRQDHRGGGVQESQMLHILRYDKTRLEKFKDNEFDFFALNISTGQTLQVKDYGNSLALYRQEIHFSAVGEGEEEAVAKMLPIVQRMDAKNEHAMALGSLLGLYSATVNSGGALESQEAGPASLWGNKDAGGPGNRAPGTQAGGNKNASVNSGGQVQATKFHQVCFVQIKFSIRGEATFSNNFLCIVPVLYQVQPATPYGVPGRFEGERGSQMASYESGALVALFPWHGAFWEENVVDRKRFFILDNDPNFYTYDARVECLRAMFDRRTFMREGQSTLRPFMHSIREQENRHKKECMVFRQNPMTFLSNMYGSLTTISQSHKAMIQHEQDFDLVLMILYGAVQLVGPHNRMANADLIDMFYVMIVFVTHVCCLGNNMYRLDYFGEDIGTL